MAMNVEQAVVEKGKCYSCFVCVETCKMHGLILKADEYGTVYPRITDSCMDCGGCLKSCPSIHPVLKHPICEGFAAVSKSEHPNSASGSAFYTIAKCFLHKPNAVIYGVTLNKNLHTKMLRVDNEYQLIKLLGSKYIKCDTYDIYHKVQKDLKENRHVLFAGTPCQIAALKSFLRKDQHNLYCLDIICHGAPSQLLFDHYIGWIEKTYHKTVINYQFRTKTGKDRDGFFAEVTFEGGKKIILKGKDDPYYGCFLNVICLNRRCYTCDFAQSERVGDITLGDWASRGKSRFYDYRAVSSVLVNTDRGKELWNLSKGFFDYIPISIEQEIHLNGQLSVPSDIDKWKPDICKRMMMDDFSAIKKELLQSIPLKKRIYEAMLESVPFVLRKKIIHFMKDRIIKS